MPKAKKETVKVKEKSISQGHLKSKGKRIRKPEKMECGFPGSSSLNKFEDEADFQVFSTRSVNQKTGKKFGKVISWQETIDEMKDHVSNDCKEAAKLGYDSKEACEIDTLREDNPSFCLFGKHNIKDAVKKIIDEHTKEINEIHDDQYQDLTEEEICHIIGIDEISCIEKETPF